MANGELPPPPVMHMLGMDGFEGEDDGRVIVYLHPRARQRALLSNSPAVSPATNPAHATRSNLRIVPSGFLLSRTAMTPSVAAASTQQPALALLELLRQPGHGAAWFPCLTRALSSV